MAPTIELSDELMERLEGHLEEDETIEESVEELLAIYEQEGRFLAEGPWGPRDLLGPGHTELENDAPTVPE